MKRSYCGKGCQEDGKPEDSDQSANLSTDWPFLRNRITKFIASLYPVGYKLACAQDLLSAEFERWLERLKDIRARIKIVARIRSMSAGNFGDTKSLGDGLFELRLHVGPGYRLYYVRRGEALYLMLKGGDKASQDRDIAKAKAMAADLDRTTS